MRILRINATFVSIFLRFLSIGLIFITTLGYFFFFESQSTETTIYTSSAIAALLGFLAWPFAANPSKLVQILMICLISLAAFFTILEIHSDLVFFDGPNYSAVKFRLLQLIIFGVSLIEVRLTWLNQNRQRN